MSAKPVQTHKLPTAAELVSQQLRVEVTSLLKTFGRRRFYNIEELKEAAEWKRLRDLFRVAGKDYATVSRGERDRLARVKEKIRSDRCAIDKPKAAMVFCMRQSRRLGVGIEEVRRVLEKKLDFAMDEGMSEATKYIAQSETPQSTPVQSKLAKEPPKEKLVFVKRKGESFARGEATDQAFLNTYESLSKIFAQIRILLSNKNGKVSAQELREQFRESELGSAAVADDWSRFIENLSPGPNRGTAKNAALCLSRIQIRLQK